MSFLKMLGGIVLVLVVLQLSCTRIPQTPALEGALTTENMARTDSIPTDWGKLVSAVISPDFPRRVQLWFQDERGDIHLAFYEMSQRKLAPKAVVFSRH